MTTESMDPYAAPQSEVRDADSGQFAEVKVFSFKGRLGRVRYMAYSMALMLLVWFGGGLLAAVAIPAMAQNHNPLMGGVAGLFMIVVYLFTLVASFTLAVRRINDFDVTGWLSLLMLVPMVNLIFILALWIIPGTQGSNRYGLQTPPNGGGVTVLAVLAPLLVVGYIGTMAAVAIPAYQQYVMKAQQAQMQQR